MRARSVFLAATGVMAVVAMVPLSGVQAPGSGVPPAAPAAAGAPQAPTTPAPPAVPTAGAGALGMPGAAQTPAAPRPNQPGFIGWERPVPNMSIPPGFT